ncbi:hypothetical protein A3F05_02725 [Candidatus Saccharibacteria bacterium RIFCSPHIGHO2_12_FULL_47_17]|nr:MAG: hypothetical protein A3F05_02725 [Candidatus Saccharibacteria bacterium RIFCSPHIGHO2_12_FULL_47_17]
MRIFRKLAKNLVVLAILALPLVGFWQRQAIFDWWRLRSYQPTPAIAALATDTQMTDQARHMFYVNHPQLLDQVETFRSSCTISEQTIVLGCYQPNQQGIYVYVVKDQRLSGIAQVTAAHEMLHAAYDRLSSKDKEYINQQLEDYYKNQLGDERIKETIKSYKKTEPDDLINEMHSIFATEIASLPPAMETYYQRYFKSRQAVVEFSSRYEAEFTSRTTSAKALEAQLNALRDKINSQEQALKAEISAINAERAKLDNLRSSGRTQEYNAAVDSFNAKVEAFNQQVAAYRRDVNSYNAILEQYNSIAGELRSLYGAIDTRVEATTTQ